MHNSSQTSHTLGFAVSKHKDWFDEQDVEAQALLDEMHSTHLAWIKDKSSSAKKSAYTCTKQKAQASLCAMQNRWWSNKAAELQEAADKARRDSLLPGPEGCLWTKRRRLSTNQGFRWATDYTDRIKILDRWAEHIRTLLNQQSKFDDTVLQTPKNT